MQNSLTKASKKLKMEKHLKKIILDYDKEKEEKGYEVSLNEAVNKIELLINLKIESLEKQIKTYKEIDSQLSFMLNQKLNEFKKKEKEN